MPDQTPDTPQNEDRKQTPEQVQSIQPEVNVGNLQQEISAGNDVSRRGPTAPVIDKSEAPDKKRDEQDFGFSM